MRCDDRDLQSKSPSTDGFHVVYSLSCSDHRLGFKFLAQAKRRIIIVVVVVVVVVAVFCGHHSKCSRRLC